MIDDLVLRSRRLGGLAEGHALRIWAFACLHRLVLRLPQVHPHEAVSHHLVRTWPLVDEGLPQFFPFIGRALPLRGRARSGILYPAHDTRSESVVTVVGCGEGGGARGWYKGGG